jgi:hypothetical protein
MQAKFSMKILGRILYSVGSRRREKADREARRECPPPYVSGCKASAHGLDFGCCTALALGFAVFTGSLRAQQMGGMETTDFKAQLENHPPPNEVQVKTLLESAKVKTLPGGRFLLTGGQKIKTFGTNGVLETLIETPQCIFDSELRSISSTSMLQFRTADGRLFTEGEGFLFHTNRTLFLSNRVHTVISNTPPGKARKR